MHLIFQITPTHQLVEANVKIHDGSMDPRASTMSHCLDWEQQIVPLLQSKP